MDHHLIEQHASITDHHGITADSVPLLRVLNPSLSGKPQNAEFTDDHIVTEADGSVQIR
ncbi:hypothetical protein [Nocardia bovistercoris]|uniref:Uncharacterized protein n=1 Tax=Nocardia bovistercoris TaxID=2785916 RepID=A0A931IJD7_9NOCA|nr:hypothetical protein [Nocardia bovistercoris]MBH0781411.1 hypothetical protein [Nocardia bovistercoris]